MLAKYSPRHSVIITSGVGVGTGVSVGKGVLVADGVSVAGRVGSGVGGGTVLVGVGGIRANPVVASSPERLPRAVTSADAALVQRISLGKVKAVWIVPSSLVTAAA